MHKPATTQSVPLDECGAKEKVSRLRVVSCGLFSAAIARLCNFLRVWPSAARRVVAGGSAAGFLAADLGPVVVRLDAAPIGVDAAATAWKIAPT